MLLLVGQLTKLIFRWWEWSWTGQRVQEFDNSHGWVYPGRVIDLLITFPEYVSTIKCLSMFFATHDQLCYGQQYNQSSSPLLLSKAKNCRLLLIESLGTSQDHWLPMESWWICPLSH